MADDLNVEVYTKASVRFCNFIIYPKNNAVLKVSVTDNNTVIF